LKEIEKQKRDGFVVQRKVDDWNEMKSLANSGLKALKYTKLTIRLTVNASMIDRSSLTKGKKRHDSITVDTIECCDTR